MVLSFFLQTSPTAPSGIPTGFYIQIALVVAIMYFLLLRPMQRQRKEQGDHGEGENQNRIELGINRRVHDHLPDPAGDRELR